jgi:hypothetical protein
MLSQSKILGRILCDYFGDWLETQQNASVRIYQRLDLALSHAHFLGWMIRLPSSFLSKLTHLLE